MRGPSTSTLNRSLHERWPPADLPALPHGVRADLEALENLCRLLPGSGRCGLIDGAVTVVESSLHHFRDEYDALLMA